MSLFTDFENSYTFSLVNETGTNLSGYYQKIFFNNISYINTKIIKNITVFDQTALNAGSVNFNGQFFTLFDRIKDTEKSFIHLVNNKDQIILNRFPLRELILDASDTTSKQYLFNLKNINWLKSYIIKTDLAFMWDRGKGVLITVYY